MSRSDPGAATEPTIELPTSVAVALYRVYHTWWFDAGTLDHDDTYNLLSIADTSAMDDACEVVAETAIAADCVSDLTALLMLLHGGQQ